MSEANCYLFDIVVPDWDSVSGDQIDALYKWMSTSGWFGSGGKRAGFVNVVRQEAMIGCFFSCEGSRESKQYDDAKVPEQRYETSFQEVFFLLFTDEGQLLLQERNIYDYVDLGMGVIRRNLLHTLADGFRTAQVRVGNEVHLENAGGKRTQEELLQFFRTYQVQTVEVSNLSGSQIPEQIENVFNPRKELMPTMRSIIADSLKRGLDYVKMVSDGKSESDLGHTPVAYALASAGQIEKIDARDPKGVPILREKEEKGEIKLEIPSSPHLSSKDLLRISERLGTKGRRESANFRRKKRRADSERGTLFDQNKR